MLAGKLYNLYITNKNITNNNYYYQYKNYLDNKIYPVLLTYIERSNQPLNIEINEFIDSFVKINGHIYIKCINILDNNIIYYYLLNKCFKSIYGMIFIARNIYNYNYNEDVYDIPIVYNYISLLDNTGKINENYSYEVLSESDTLINQLKEYYNSIVDINLFKKSFNYKIPKDYKVLNLLKDNIPLTDIILKNIKLLQYNDASNPSIYAYYLKYLTKNESNIIISIGRSGTGKTALLKSLYRLYENPELKFYNSKGKKGIPEFDKLISSSHKSTRGLCVCDLDNNTTYLDLPGSEDRTIIKKIMELINFGGLDLDKELIKEPDFILSLYSDYFNNFNNSFIRRFYNKTNLIIIGMDELYNLFLEFTETRLNIKHILIKSPNIKLSFIKDYEQNPIKCFYDIQTLRNPTLYEYQIYKPVKYTEDMFNNILILNIYDFKNYIQFENTLTYFLSTYVLEESNNINLDEDVDEIYELNDKYEIINKELELLNEKIKKSIENLKLTNKKLEENNKDLEGNNNNSNNKDIISNNNKQIEENNKKISKQQLFTNFIILEKSDNLKEVKNKNFNLRKFYLKLFKPFIPVNDTSIYLLELNFNIYYINDLNNLAVYKYIYDKTKFNKEILTIFFKYPVQFIHIEFYNIILIYPFIDQNIIKSLRKIKNESDAMEKQLAQIQKQISEENNGKKYIVKDTSIIRNNINYKADFYFSCYIFSDYGFIRNMFIENDIFIYNNNYDTLDKTYILNLKDNSFKYKEDIFYNMLILKNHKIPKKTYMPYINNDLVFSMDIQGNPLIFQEENYSKWVVQKIDEPFSAYINTVINLPQLDYIMVDSEYDILCNSGLIYTHDYIDEYKFFKKLCNIFYKNNSIEEYVFKMFSTLSKYFFKDQIYYMILTNSDKDMFSEYTNICIEGIYSMVRNHLKDEFNNKNESKLFIDSLEIDICEYFFIVINNKITKSKIKDIITSNKKHEFVDPEPYYINKLEDVLYKKYTARIDENILFLESENMTITYNLIYENDNSYDFIDFYLNQDKLKEKEIEDELNEYKGIIKNNYIYKKNDIIYFPLYLPQLGTILNKKYDYLEYLTNIDNSKDNLLKYDYYYE